MAVTRPGEKPALPSGSTIIGLLVIFSEALNRKRSAGRALIARPTQGSQRLGAWTARVSLTHRQMSIYGNRFAAASDPRRRRPAPTGRDALGIRGRGRRRARSPERGSG